MSRPRLLPLYSSVFVGIQATIQTVLFALMIRATRDFPLMSLWGLALLWGVTLGSLLHAFWPRVLPGDERGRGAWQWSRPVMQMYLWTMLVTCSVPAVINGSAYWGRDRSSKESYRQVTESLRRVGTLYELDSSTCELLPKAVGSARQRQDFCFYSQTDGVTTVEKLRWLVQSRGMRIIESKSSRPRRQGNVLTGYLYVEARQQLISPPVPFTIEYRGLLYVNPKEPLTAEERALAEEKYHSYAIVRPEYVHEK